MAASLSAWSELSLLYRLLADLGPYLRRSLTPEECHRIARADLRLRSTAFLETLEHAVFAVPSSPYRRLLEHADVAMPDIRRSVEEKGVEGTLSDLHAAGVYLTLGEFKGRTPVVRDGLTIETGTRDFDNPLSGRHFMAQTGGSRSSGTRIYVDLAHYAHDAVYDYLFAEAFGVLDRPWGSWRTAPPHGAGIKSHLSRAKLGRRSVAWFSQSRLRLRSRAWKHAVLMETVFLGSLIAGRPVRRPRHVPLGEAWRVAAWLEEQCAAGAPALMNTNAASGVRIAMAALERGMDISGTLFRLGGRTLHGGQSERPSVRRRTVGVPLHHGGDGPHRRCVPERRSGRRRTHRRGQDRDHPEAAQWRERCPRPGERLHHASPGDPQTDVERGERRLRPPRPPELRLPAGRGRIRPPHSGHQELGEAHQRGA